MTEDVDRALRQVQMREKVVELALEEVHPPECLVAGCFGEASGEPAADLVIEDEGNGRGAEVGQRKKVIVAGTGTAVKDDERHGGG